MADGLEELEALEGGNIEADEAGASSQGTNMLHARRERSGFWSDFARIAAPLGIPANNPLRWYQAVRARPLLTTAYYSGITAIGAGLAYSQADGDINTANVAITALDTALDGVFKTSLFASAAYTAGHVINWATTKNFSDYKTFGFGVIAALGLTFNQAVDGNEKGTANMSLLYTDTLNFVPSVVSEVTDRIAPSSMGTWADAYTDQAQSAHCQVLLNEGAFLPSWLGCRTLGKNGVEVIIDGENITDTLKEPANDDQAVLRPTNTTVSMKHTIG